MIDWFLSDDAIGDLRDLLQFGVETWGEPRTRSYLASLYELFDHFVDNPEMGRSRPELRPHFRTFPHRSHVIVYMAWNNEIAIVRVLHGSMDYENLFQHFDPVVALQRD